ncbi:hypothetical protein [Corynebacterium jeddahense]|uniref:DNA-binding transcriptional regulator of glucitol operon n=1 Tax=Corynebacterium jeddahense TaxID=1414719 RepID=A0ABY7ULC3_9CORY|nr:hypothetical protein [Corynebacterium jeddahense]WCZ39520.1 hypothetical protein CJEDD_09695 [Corynebacterium jeddahense]
MSEEKQEGAGGSSQRERVKVRWWHIVLLVAAAVTCLLLARWQWHRYQSGSGTFQNLGYALQWPCFAAFFVYAYRAGMRMENEKIDAENAGLTMDDLYEADEAKYGSASKQPTQIDEDFLPARPKLNVEEYNELVAPHRERQHEGEGKSA